MRSICIQPLYFVIICVFKFLGYSFRWNVPPANFLLHFEQSQIPFAWRFARPLQNGHSCFIRCFLSTAISLFLTFPYPAPNLPALPIFFFFTAILLFLCLYPTRVLLKWGHADLNRGREVPNLESYQARPWPHEFEEF